MNILEIIFALSWIWIPLLIVYLIIRNNKKSSQQDNSYAGKPDDTSRDQLWLNYLRSFQGVVQTKAENKLIETLIEGRSSDELYAKHQTPAVAPAPISYNSAQLASYETLAEAPQPSVSYEAYRQPVKQSAPIDNTILLLYFGAFLLVASVGLFVAIGTLGGFARTAIVAVTAAILYFGGLWLYETNKKLEQAGVSFVGTGMMIAPLVGVAWHNLVSDANAGLVWLLTSLVCVALYAYAYHKIENDFISYLLIGSFVSSIESAVLTIDLPSYGYAWGLIAAGLALMVNNRLRNPSARLEAASSVSSQLLIPLSVLGSLVLIPEFGSTQLAVTLFLSGAYYSLLAWWQPEERTTFSVTAQLSYLSALASLVYSLEQSINTTGVVLLVAASVYTVTIAIVSRDTMRVHSLANIAAVSTTAGVLLSISQAWPFTAGLALAVILSAVIWRRLESDLALQIGCLVLGALPFVGGQYALQLDLASWQQTALCGSAALLLGGLGVLCSLQSSYKESYVTSSVMYILAASLVFIPAWGLGYGVVVGIATAIALSFILFRKLSKETDWLVGSGIVMLVPFIHALSEHGIDSLQFSAGVALALVWNIAVSLVTRQSLSRWVVVACILIAPFALGGGGIGIDWEETGYAGGYVLAMASCILARAIARGKLLLSFKVPIASYYTKASEAYVTGYVFAGTVALFTSLYSEDSQLVTTLVLAAIGICTVIVAKIENNKNLYALLPVIVQGILFSAIRPDFNVPMETGIMALASVVTAAGAYALSITFNSEGQTTVSRWVSMVSVMTAYIGPALALGQPDPSLLLPLSLFIAGLLTYGYNHTAQQSSKELSAAVCIAAVHWFVFLLDYTNIHVHTHLLALSLGSFALWRSSIGDNEASQNYIKSLFFVVTIPLALQSLSGEEGGVYGLILIAEQVGFMVIGASFGQRFLLRWGLWTALGAVLFQLRGLGWAFLSLLALIVIGVAVYRLQKHQPEDT